MAKSVRARSTLTGWGTRAVPVAAVVVLALAGAPMTSAGATVSGAVTGPMTGSATTARTISPGDTFHIQFAGRLDRTMNASVYEVDCEDTPASVVADLHRRGRTVVGYLSAGSWEDYRDDAAKFPAVVKGRVLDGWPHERWLDVRRMRILRPIVSARLDRCAAKGFDAVEFDNVDGYSNRTGFPLTKADQLRYDSWLARAAHRRGLQPGLKNSLGLVRDLVDDFDWALNEQCVQYRECGRYRPFIDAGKAVFVLEYRVTVAHMCAVTTPLGLVAQKKHLNLDAWRVTC